MAFQEKRSAGFAVEDRAVVEAVAAAVAEVAVVSAAVAVVVVAAGRADVDAGA